MQGFIIAESSAHTFVAIAIYTKDKRLSFPILAQLIALKNHAMIRFAVINFSLASRFTKMKDSITYQWLKEWIFSLEWKDWPSLLLIPVLIFSREITGKIKRFLNVLLGSLFGRAYHRALRVFYKKMASHFELKDYARKNLEGRSKYLHVPSTHDIKLEVDRTFISLFLKDYGQLRKTYTPENILTLGNRIRVVGDPGSGKSSLVKKLFRNECYHALKSRKDKSEFLARLPILIELRELVPPEKQSPPGEWLYEHIRALVIKSSTYDAEKFFDSYVGKDGDGLLVLLDGMDEVSSDFYLRIRQAISELSSHLQNCNEKNTIILTMRTQFHQQVQNEYRDSFGVAVYIKPFTPSDIYEFLSRWHFEQDAQSNIARIYSALTDAPTLREMCSNPLVLAMYVAEDQERGYSATPESRTEFYKRVTEELIIRRRLKQTGSVPSHTTAQRRRERVLGRIAYLHLLNEGESLNSLCWKSATKIVAEIFKCKADEAEQALQEIAKETGLITAERVGETFRFIHLTFCEFLGALEATERQNNGWHALLDAHQKLQEHGRRDQRSRLVEVIPFAAGLAPEKLHSKYLNDIKQLGDGSLLARCFLETKAYEHPAWSVFLDQEKGKLQTIGRSKWSHEALEGLHIFSAVVNDAKKCEEHGVIIEGLNKIDDFFSLLLRGEEKNDLRPVMASYANQDAVAAFRLAELSGLNMLIDYPDIVVENCAQPLFLALAVDLAKKDINNTCEWALVFFVAASTSSPALKNIFAQPAITTWHMPEDNTYNKQLEELFADGLLLQCIVLLFANNNLKYYPKDKLSGICELLGIQESIFSHAKFIKNSTSNTLPHSDLPEITSDPMMPLHIYVKELVFGIEKEHPLYLDITLTLLSYLIQPILQNSELIIYRHTRMSGIRFTSTRWFYLFSRDIFFHHGLLLVYSKHLKQKDIKLGLAIGDREFFLRIIFYIFRPPALRVLIGDTP